MFGAYIRPNLVFIVFYCNHFLQDMQCKMTYEKREKKKRKKDTWDLKIVCGREGGGVRLVFMYRDKMDNKLGAEQLNLTL